MLNEIMTANPNKTMIEELREIRDKISNDLSFNELNEYLEKKSAFHPKMKKQKTVSVQ